MKFSTIIATKNAAGHLRRCLNSIFSQEYQSYEIIIQDCASEDGTQEIVEELPEGFKERIDLRSEKDSGVYDAWNRALARASGDWAIFLGADDCFADRDVLMRARADLVRMPEHTDFAYGALLTGRNGRVEGILERSPAEAYRILLSGMGFPFPATFCRLATLKQYAFDPSYRIAGDYDMVARAVRCDNIARLPLSVSYMEEGGLSTNKKFRDLMLSERVRVIRTHILPKAAMLLQTHLECLGKEG
ncbi:MAG: glycosyltransferase [Desulfovibrio sp.]|jgi:glycosyltransferase involved in cell wall biosynthesis|nr:glycosyltransferase [Desulfovibrio sp.]